jgi:hypothetical protein
MITNLLTLKTAARQSTGLEHVVLRSKSLHGLLNAVIAILAHSRRGQPKIAAPIFVRKRSSG